MSALQGVRMTLDEQDIGAKLPTLGGSAQKVLALNLHVKLAKITAFIQSSKCGIPDLRAHEITDHVKLCIVEPTRPAATF